MKPAISIVLPVHNNAETIAECIESILSQTFRCFEVLIINDGSTDSTVHIIEQFAQIDTRIRLFHAGRIGLVNALNLGIGHARADLIARMDGDDLMHPQRLEKQQRFMEQHPDIGLVASRARLFPEQCIQRGYHEYMKWQNHCLSHEQISEQIYVESPFAHPSVMFRKHILDRFGDYRHGDFPEDYELWLRLHHAGVKMAKLPDYLLKWREYPQRTSRIDVRYQTDAFDQLRARYLAQDPNIPSDRPLVFWGAGRKTRQRAAHLISKGFAVTAWIDIDPKKIGNRINSIPVNSPGWLDRQPRPYVLNYVNNYGAREQIAIWLQQLGYKPKQDYMMIG